ncbi:MAG: DUF4838 domain-containing protein [Victivallales bacterium]|nr:DUF4838 domain-containing protein [Victivallales bacterium]
MKRFVAFLLIGASLMLSAATVLLSGNPAPAEKTAASELEKYLAAIAGSSDAVQATFHVGQTPEALEVFNLQSWNDLQQDEVLYLVKDGEVWLAGAAPRGTLYAVYEFLEREYGVRFFTFDDELVPPQKPFRLPPDGTSCRYAPPFIQRSAAYTTINNNHPAFAAKMRNNYFYTPSAPEWGGYNGLIGWCHTFAQFLPAEKYYQDHPEWYSLQNGIRLGGPQFQMCLTNREMRQELVKVVRQKLKENPDSTFISVSQNDNHHPCQCPECKKFIRQHGNETDLLLDCVNEVADMVAQEFPKVFVETLAYTYTRQPPKTIRPRDNVAIRYCTIEAAALAPVDSPRNAILANELKAWQPIAKHTMIWNYVTDFARYYLPHPNWTFLDQDLRFFRDNNAISIFEQGSFNHCVRAADLTDLRAYVISRLLWNPDLDGQALIHEFVEHHYGPAAPHVFAYLDGVTKASANHPECLDNCYPPNTDKWLSDAERAKIWSEVFSGVEKYEDDPVYGPRMAIAALPITMDLLDHPDLLTTAPEERLPELRDVDIEKLLDFCEKYLALADAKDLQESRSLPTSQWLANRRTTASGKVHIAWLSEGEAPEGLPENEKWWGWNTENIGQLYGESMTTIALCDDPNAVGGKAVRMPNIHTEWYLQMARLPIGFFELYFTVRCQLKPGCKAEGKAMTCGNYPAGPVSVAIDAADIAGEEYKLVKLGVTNLGKAQYVYCAPVINENVESIWIDRLIVIRPQDQNGNPAEVVEEWQEEEWQ